jgi:predicted transcriptional regulator
MNQSVERTSLDLRFANYRLRNNATEARLLASIAEQGIEQALTGVDTPSGRLLLDGFKRWRCAKRLGIESVPYVSLGVEEAAGILRWMQASKEKTLHMLEQARFVTELLDTHGMTVAEVAETLSRSKAWVSVRRGLLSEMPETLQKILFRGEFPVYSYMYTLRPFMRINDVPSKQIEQFVEKLSGQKLSHREIELLAHGYFRGPASLRTEIDAGNWKWTLDQLQSVPEDPEACNDTEKSLLRDFETLVKAMARIQVRCDHQNLQTRAFFAQANLLVGRLLSEQEAFFQKLEHFHDRSGKA